MLNVLFFECTVSSNPIQVPCKNLGNSSDLGFSFIISVDLLKCDSSLLRTCSLSLFTPGSGKRTVVRMQRLEF